MNKTIFTALFVGIAATAAANTMTISYKQQTADLSSFDVYLAVQGANTGVLNYDLAVNNVTTIPGLSSGTISYAFTKLDNINASFQPSGFPVANNLAGASGANAWSAGASQFGAASPIVGLGRQAVFVDGADVIPNNPDISVAYVTEPEPVGLLGSKVGTLDLKVDTLTQAQLQSILGGGGTVFNNAAGAPIALTSPASIRVIMAIPEPTSFVLGGLALVGAAVRRRV
jgi:hypothetical protein